MGPLRYICEGRRVVGGRLISGRTRGGDVVQTGRVRGSIQRFITREGVQRGFSAPISNIKTGTNMI